MQENAPQLPNNKDNKFKITRRAFGKWLGASAAVVGAAVVGGKLGTLVQHMSEEAQRHERLGEAVVVKKEILNSKGMEPMIDKDLIPYKGVDECFMYFKINDIESSVEVSYDTYKKYKIGDKVPVKYDDRYMQVNQILDEQ